MKVSDVLPYLQRWSRIVRAHIPQPLITFCRTALQLLARIPGVLWLGRLLATTAFVTRRRLHILYSWLTGRTQLQVEREFHRNKLEEFVKTVQHYAHDTGSTSADIVSVLKHTISALNCDNGIQHANATIKSNYEILDSCCLDTQLFHKDALIALLLSIAESALRFPNLFPRPVKHLQQNVADTIWLSSRQAHCLLANAFFCTFPGRNRARNRNGGSECSRLLPDINFTDLFAKSDHRSTSSKVEKLKCILNYFERRRISRECETMLSYERKCLKIGPTGHYGLNWADCDVLLGQVVVNVTGSIESAVGCLQVDFANKYVGGGVLGNGAVMEEIRFASCPELIVARLFTEALADNEVLVVAGAQQYSGYSGYRQSFRFTGNSVDPTPIDSAGRKGVQIVCMDALNFGRDSAFVQFRRDAVLRELNKCFCAFAEPNTSLSQLSPVASGRWGCGVFNGDVQLKTLLQLMAASVADRRLILHTMGSRAEGEELNRFNDILRQRALTVSHCLNLIELYWQTYAYSGQTGQGSEPQLSLFEFIQHAYN